MTTDLPLKALIESLENNNKDLNLPIEIIEKIYEIETNIEVKTEKHIHHPNTIHFRRWDCSYKSNFTIGW